MLHNILRVVLLVIIVYGSIMLCDYLDEWVQMQHKIQYELEREK